MKIGIVTHPLKANYGGVLQCAALYDYLVKSGHDVTVIQKEHVSKGLNNFIINILKILPFQNIKGIRKTHLQTLINQNFIEQYIPSKSKKFYTTSELSKYAQEAGFDAVVVGSDQVWRFSYINDGYFGTYFLDFIDANSSTLKISYAASFGTDYWESEPTKPEVSNWLKKFDAISVREKSGLTICKDDFKVDGAEHVLDPTLLPDQDFYNQMISQSDLQLPSEPYILTYVLDEAEEKRRIIDHVKQNIDISVEEFHLLGFNKERTNYKIWDWLKAFKSARYIVTDSFHGTIFCIIFRKQFLVIGNKDRGLSRFQSFLGELNLLDRIWSPDIAINFEYSKETIDILNAKIASSKLFLSKALLKEKN